MYDVEFSINPLQQVDICPVVPEFTQFFFSPIRENYIL